jgi:hypothetical protein
MKMEMSLSPRWARPFAAERGDARGTCATGRGRRLGVLELVLTLVARGDARGDTCGLTVLQVRPEVVWNSLPPRAARALDRTAARLLPARGEKLKSSLRVAMVDALPEPLRSGWDLSERAGPPPASLLSHDRIAANAAWCDLPPEAVSECQALATQVGADVDLLLLAHHLHRKIYPCPVEATATGRTINEELAISPNPNLVIYVAQALPAACCLLPAACCRRPVTRSGCLPWAFVPTAESLPKVDHR